MCRFLDWPEFSVFHVGGIRSIERMLLDYFCDFVEKVFPKGRPPLSKIEEACWKMAEKNFQTNDHKKIVESFFKLFREELTPYKQNLYGPHPPALLPYLQNPRFQIIYDKNGQIIGRIPDCVWEI